MWAPIETQKVPHLGRMGNIEKVQNHEYHVPEESRKDMDVEKPKLYNKVRI